jgi:phage-related protein (TIGR01555 family)
MFQKLRSYFPKNPMSLIRQTLDGFMNVLTGLNSARDKKTHTQIFKKRKLTYQELQALFRDSRYAKKICIRPAAEMTKHDLCFDEENPDSILFSDKLKKMKYNFHSKEALVFEAWSGGSAIIMNIMDGGLLHEPVKENRIKDIGNDLIVVDRNHIRPVEGLFNPRVEPEFYYVNLANGETFIIHVSRLLTFRGVEVATIEERIENHGFADSILQSLESAIKNIAESVDTCASILTDFSQTVYKIAGLNDDLEDKTGKGEEDVIKRLLLMDRAKSTVRAAVMDKEDEFNRSVAGVQGVKEFISIFKDDLTAQTDFPGQILHGDSFNASLGDAGQPELIQWFSNISEQRNDRWKPQCEKLLRYISLWLKKDVPQWEYANLWDLDDVEKATIEKLEAETEKAQADTDTSYITNTMFTPEERKALRVEVKFGKMKNSMKLKSPAMLKNLKSLVSGSKNNKSTPNQAKA